MTQAFNRDCLEAMREFPDKFFDLAVVDPPYGDGSSQNVQVERERERERTGERKRTELQGNRAKADGCCKQSGSDWNLWESDRNTHRDEHIEKHKDNAPGQDVRTARNRGSEWKDWRRGCL